MEQFRPSDIRVYADDAKPGQFLEYFYPGEQVFLRTNNYERHEHRAQRTSKFFRDERDLQLYLKEMSDSSDDREDRPPASEELFFDSQEEELFDDIARRTRYAPPLTQLQRDLLRNIAQWVVVKGDDAPRTREKLGERFRMIRGYCKDLKRRRFARTYKRFTKVRAQKLDLISESARLHDEEIADKHLNRQHYYGSAEPSEYAKHLLPARRSAVAAKYHQYALDPLFRQTYRNNVYYNVNLNVPVDDLLHIFGADHQQPPIETVKQPDEDLMKSIRRPEPNVETHLRTVRTTETVEQVSQNDDEWHYKPMLTRRHKPSVPPAAIVKSHVTTTYESDETKMMQSFGDDQTDEIVRHTAMITASVKLDGPDEDERMQQRSHDASITYHPDAIGGDEILRRVTTTKTVQFIEELRYEESGDEDVKSEALTPANELDYRMAAGNEDRAPALVVLPGLVDWMLRNVKPRTPAKMIGEVERSPDSSMFEPPPVVPSDEKKSADAKNAEDVQLDDRQPGGDSRAPGVLVLPGLMDWLLRNVKPEIRPS